MNYHLSGSIGVGECDSDGIKFNFDDWPNGYCRQVSVDPSEPHFATFRSTTVRFTPPTFDSCYHYIKNINIIMLLQWI
jgi:hypothetical protein